MNATAGAKLERTLEQLRAMDVRLGIMQQRLAEIRAIPAEERDWSDNDRCNRAALIRCLPWAYRVHRVDSAANCLLHLGQFEECVEALERVHELQPTNLIANDLLVHWYGTIQDDREEAKEYQHAIDEEVAVDPPPHFDPLLALWRCYLPEEIGDADAEAEAEAEAVAAAGRSIKRPMSAALGRAVGAGYSGSKLGAVDRAGKLPPLEVEESSAEVEVERGTAAVAAAAAVEKKLATNLVAQAFKVQPTYASVLRKVRSCYSGPLSAMENAIFERGPDEEAEDGGPTESLADKALREAQERGQRERKERAAAKLAAEEEAGRKAVEAAAKAAKRKEENAKSTERLVARNERNAAAAKRKAELAAGASAREYAISSLGK